MSPRKVFKVAILGVEEIGECLRHDTTPRPENTPEGWKEFEIYDIVACWDTDEERSKLVAKTFGLEARSLEAILNDPEIDVIQTRLLYDLGDEIGKKVLEHGKHLITEKMLATTFEKGKELCELAEKMGVRIAAGPDCMLSASMQTARYVVDKGLVGKITSGVISFTRDNRQICEFLPFLYKVGGNVLYDMTGYYLYTASGLLGPVRQLSAFCKKSSESHRVLRIESPLYGQEIPMDDYDILTAVIEYECGALLTLHINSATIMEQRWTYELYGEDGMIKMEHPHTFDLPVIVQKKIGEPFEFPLAFGFRSGNASGSLGIADLCWGILNNRPHRPDAAFSLHMMELDWAIGESARTGKVYKMTTTCERPATVPEGYLGKSFYNVGEESALAMPQNP